MRPIRVALTGDTATQLLAQALRGLGYEHSLDICIFEAGYDQIDQQLRDRSSSLYEFRPEFILIFMSVKALQKNFYALEPTNRLHFYKSQIFRLESWIDIVAAEAPGAKVIVLNWPESLDEIFGHFGNKTKFSFLSQIRWLNCALSDLTQVKESLFVLDLAALCSQYGNDAAIDRRNYIESDLLYNLDFWPLIAKAAVAIINALNGVIKKCLILDLDNTLWGGVLGDDGVGGIEIGDLKQGKAFSEIQRWALGLQERGILLAICSKNDERIAREPFESHPQMVLKLHHIAIFIANWESKVDNIKRIKDFLKIGYDSIVFLDDSPHERALVREYLPDLCVPELPNDASDYLPFLCSLNLFETATFTQQDSDRTGQFHAEEHRNESMRTFTDESDFLKHLNITADIRPFDDVSTSRIAQLSQRSNQFNLRVQRYSQTEISAISRSPLYSHFAINLKDRFGDHGLISIIILEHRKDILFINTWIMSCRVLRRGVEYLALKRIVEIAIKSGAKTILGEYCQTGKNGLVSLHYSALGFTEVDKGFWSLTVSEYRPRKHFIEQLNTTY